MSGPRAPWTVRIVEVLADGEWHALDELVRVEGALIPPGQAARDAESKRLEKSARRHGAPRPRTRPGDPTEVGRRQMIRDALWGLARHGVVERGATARYRLVKR